MLTLVIDGWTDNRNIKKICHNHINFCNSSENQGLSLVFFSKTQNNVFCAFKLGFGSQHGGTEQSESAFRFRFKKRNVFNMRSDIIMKLPSNKFTVTKNTQKDTHGTRLLH